MLKCASGKSCTHAMYRYMSRIGAHCSARPFPKFFDLLHLPPCLKLRSTAGTSSRLNTDLGFLDSVIKSLAWYNGFGLNAGPRQPANC